MGVGSGMLDSFSTSNSSWTVWVTNGILFCASLFSGIHQSSRLLTGAFIHCTRIYRWIWGYIENCKMWLCCIWRSLLTGDGSFWKSIRALKSEQHSHHQTWTCPREVSVPVAIGGLSTSIWFSVKFQGSASYKNWSELSRELVRRF